MLEEKLKDLTKYESKQLLRLIAVHAEKSYRRGFQHGSLSKVDQSDVYYWRYYRTYKISEPFIKDNGKIKKNFYNILSRIKIEAGEGLIKTLLYQAGEA